MLIKSSNRFIKALSKQLKMILENNPLALVYFTVNSHECVKYKQIHTFFKVSISQEVLTFGFEFRVGNLFPFMNLKSNPDGKKMKKMVL